MKPVTAPKNNMPLTQSVNPLSLYAHQSSNLLELVRDAVVQLGFDKEKLNALSAHDTIAIKLRELPDMMVSVLDDRLWLWSLLPGTSNARVSNMAAEILSILVEPVEGVEAGHLCLGVGDNGYELKALVKLECLKHELGLLPVFSAYIEKMGDIWRTLGIR